jgi:uncharacterized membrane protein
MHSRRCKHSIPKCLSVLVTLAALLTTVAITASAQQSPIHHGKSRLLTDDGPGTRATATARPIQRSASNISGSTSSVKYKTVRIGVLPGKTNSLIAVEVNIINNLGHVAAYSFVADNVYGTAQPFLWKDGKLNVLPLPQGAAAAYATGVNDRDQVIAETNEFDSNGVRVRRGFMFDHGKVIVLPALDTDSNTQPFAINNWGSAVGTNHNRVTGSSNPVVWSGGKIHALPLLPGQDTGFAFGINDFGVIAGYQFPADDSSEVACLWYWNGNGYKAVALASLGGDFGEAFGINNWGQSVGFSTNAGNLNGLAALWDSRGPHALPLLPGDTDGFANAINDFGQITGYNFGVDENGDDTQAVVLWQGGKVTNLQTVVPSSFPDITDIGNVNLSGQIVVETGYFDDGSLAPYVLIPKDN